MNITGGKHFGTVTVRRYGVEGSVCDAGWDDRDARVLCRQFGFVVSCYLLVYALKTKSFKLTLSQLRNFRHFQTERLCR